MGGRTAKRTKPVYRVKVHPVITRSRVREVEELLERADALRDALHDVCERLAADLAVLSGNVQPEDWTEIEVVDD